MPLGKSKVGKLSAAAGSKAMASPANYNLQLQAYQVEPAIVSQAINNGIRRLRATDADVQAAERFLEALLGRKLAYTLADVAPLAQAIRTRVGFAAKGVPTGPEGLKHASVYASLLGQALYYKSLVGAYMELLRAYSGLIADARSGPPTAMGQAMVQVATENVALWRAKVDSADSFCTSGDSKDLYMLLQGSSEWFSDSPSGNLFSKTDQLACAKKIDLVTAEDGLGDLSAASGVIKKMADLVAKLDATIGKEVDYEDLSKVRRVGKELQFADAAGTGITSLGALQAAFAANGRLFVRVK